MKKWLSLCLTFLFIMGCKMNQAPTNTSVDDLESHNPIENNEGEEQPKPEFPSEEIPSKPLENKGFDLTTESTPKGVDESTLDEKAGDKILGGSSTYVQAASARAQDDDALIYYGKAWVENRPLKLNVVQYGSQAKDPKRANKVTLRVELTSNVTDNMAGFKDTNFFPAEELKDFTVEKQMIQFAGNGLEPKSVIIEEDNIASDKQVNFAREFLKGEGADEWLDLVRDAKHLLDNKSYAIVRFAWEGSDAQGQKKTLYSKEFKLENGTGLLTLSNMIAVFEKLDEQSKSNPQN